jgi:hypothetical protein
MLLVGAAVLATGVAVAAAGGYLAGASTILHERFTELRDNPRIDQYRHAVRSIGEHPWLGRGFAARLDNADANRVHNLLLSAWFEAGALGLVAVSLLLLVIVAVWGRAMGLWGGLEPWKLAVSRPAILMLPVLPIFRAMVSGEGGHFAFVEWTCLAFFAGTIGANRAIVEASTPEGSPLFPLTSSTPLSAANAR